MACASGVCGTCEVCMAAMGRKSSDRTPVENAEYNTQLRKLAGEAENAKNPSARKRALGKIAKLKEERKKKS